MKIKTLIELLTLSSTVYHLTKDSHILERLKELSEKGVEYINISGEPIYDEFGNEIQFMDKVLLKTNQFKEEIEQEIEALVIKFYKKVNIAHLDEIKALNEKLTKSNEDIALLEARLNKLEAKK